MSCKKKEEINSEKFDLSHEKFLQVLASPVLLLHLPFFLFCFFLVTLNCTISFVSMLDDQYCIPKVVDCSTDLNHWVYPDNADLYSLLHTPPHQLPECVRRFTQDIYMCIYTSPNKATMYGDTYDTYGSIQDECKSGMVQERVLCQSSDVDLQRYAPAEANSKNDLCLQVELNEVFIM